MRIAKLNLKNGEHFKFKEQTIEFREKTARDKAEIHFLVGENGAGKDIILYGMANKLAKGEVSNEGKITLDKHSNYKEIFYRGGGIIDVPTNPQISFAFLGKIFSFPDFGTFGSINKEILQLIGKNLEGGLKHLEQAINTVTTEKIELTNASISDFNHLPNDIKFIIDLLERLLPKNENPKQNNRENLLDKIFILFLDEIEVTLHPKLQRKILPVIQKLFKNAQIFITTNSSFLVGSVDDAWIYKLKKEERGLTIIEPAILSQAGKSNTLLLSEIFDIEDEFGEIVSKELNEFYDLLDKLFHKNFEQEEAFLKKARALAERGLELRDIVGSEIRQLNRILNKDYSL